MLKSRRMQNLLRFLITLLGAGVGVALALGVVQCVRMAKPDYEIEFTTLVAGYGGMALIFMFFSFLLSRKLLHVFSKAASESEVVLDKLTLPQILSRVIGLILGLVIAALATQVLHFMGGSLFTTIFSLILNLVLGMTGYNMGRKRSSEFESLLAPPGLHGKRFTNKNRARHLKKSRASTSLYLIDSSVLIDGRIVDMIKLGFLDGEFIAPDFMLNELHKLADNPDPLKRSRGRRALDKLAEMQQLPLHFRTEYPQVGGNDEVDVKLLKLAKKTGAAILSTDYNLGKIAKVSGVRLLNLNELAGILRPVVAAGDELEVQIIKDGKEPSQGIAYLPDGTMIVVEGGRMHMNESIHVTVTSALQTNAGRMVFAKVRE